MSAVEGTTEELSGRIALVTGAGGSGIGTAIVEGLARRGASILAIDRSAKTLEERLLEWRELGWTAAGAASDVRDQSGVADAIHELSRASGGPDIVVNSAGIGSLEPLPEVSSDQWADLFAVNVTGAANVIRAVIPRLVESGGGAIVNVSSLAAKFPPGGAPAYAASKAALDSLTRSVAIDYGPVGIRCNAVAPGPVRTPYVERHLAAMQHEIDSIPLGRLAERREVADAVCFLVSDRASYISGQVLALSGGRPT